MVPCQGKAAAALLVLLAMGTACAQGGIQLRPIQIAGQILFENFEQQPLANWTLPELAGPAPLDGSSALVFAGPGRATWNVPGTRELTLSFRVRLDDGIAVVGLCVGGVAPNPWEYTLAIGPDDMALRWSTGPVRREMATAQTPTPGDVWHQFTVVLTDLGIEVRRDNATVLGANLERKLPGGVVTIGCLHGGGVAFDDLALGPPGATPGQLAPGPVQPATPIPIPGPVVAAQQAPGALAIGGPIVRPLEGATGPPPALGGPLGGGTNMMTIGGGVLGAPQIFLKFDPAVVGSSQAEGHQGEIEVLEYQYGLGPPPADGLWANASLSLPGSASGQRPLISALTILKHVDKSSPKLYLLCAQGKPVPTATLVIGGYVNQVFRPAMTFEMSNALILGVRSSASASPGAIPSEQVAIGFAKIKWTYWETDPSGTSLTPIAATWDLTANQGN